MVTRQWYLELHLKWSNNIDIAVESMRRLLYHVDSILTICKTQSTLDFNQLLTGKNIHKKYGAKKIFQISIYISNIVQLAFQYTLANKTTR